MNENKVSIGVEISKSLENKPNQTVEDLARSIGVPVKKLSRYIKYMERSGEIFSSKGKYALAKRKSTVGTIEIARGGFGFVASEDKSLFPDDIFIPAHATGGAMSGDRVRISISKSKPRNGSRGGNSGRDISGKVDEVIKRNSTMIVGVVEDIDGVHYIDPFDDSLHTLIRMGDPSNLGLKEGDVVVCKIIDFKTMRVKLHSKLGSMEDENIDVLIASVRFGVMMGYSKEMNDEALDVIREHKDNDQGRHNLNALFTVTIDGATSKDFDDAISLEYDGKKGVFHLYVHVADVTHYVRSNSVIDQDALRRGTSVYLPTYTSHMLPEILAGDICSLKPGRKRFAMTAHMKFDKSGKKLGGKITQTVITSDKRLTYDYVNQIISGDVISNEEQLQQQIHTMYRFSEILRERRLKDGYIEFKSEEPYFHFDTNWRLVGLSCKKNGKAEKLIEMFMLEANELAATIINEEYGYGVFRIHPDPEPKNIMAFREFCAMNHIKLPHIDPENITSKGVQSMVKAVEGDRMESVLTPMLIRSMQKASYDTNSTVHFALSSQEYTHFTSPIRRYPDIIVHRLLKTIENNIPPIYSRDEVGEMLEQCNRREDMATSAQRYCETFKKLQYISSKINEQRIYDACVTRIVAGAILVYLPQVMLRCTVLFDDMANKDFETDKSKMVVVVHPDNTKIRIGDMVRVSLVRVQFTLLEATMVLEDLNDKTANPFRGMKKSGGRKKSHKKRTSKNKRNSGKSKKYDSSKPKNKKQYRKK